MLAVDLDQKLIRYIEKTASAITAEVMKRKAKTKFSRSRVAEIRGVAGEVAARIVLGEDPFGIKIEWRGRKLDVLDYEIRCRSRANYVLPLTGLEPPGSKVVLLTAEEYPDVIYFRRWGYAHDYFSDRFRKAPPRLEQHNAENNIHGYEFFVPLSAMRLAETLPDLRSDWRDALRYINDNGLPYAHPDFQKWRDLADEHEARRRKRERLASSE